MCAIVFWCGIDSPALPIRFGEKNKRKENERGSFKEAKSTVAFNSDLEIDPLSLQTPKRREVSRLHSQKTLANSTQLQRKALQNTYSVKKQKQNTTTINNNIVKTNQIRTHESSERRQQMNTYIYDNLFGLKTTVEDTSYVVYNLYLRRIRKLQSSGVNTSVQNVVSNGKACNDRVSDGAASTTVRCSEKSDRDIQSLRDTHSSIPSEAKAKDNPLLKDRHHHKNNISTTSYKNSSGSGSGGEEVEHVLGVGSSGSRPDSSYASSSPHITLLSPNILGSTQVPNLPERNLLEDHGRTSKDSNTTEPRHDLSLSTIAQYVEKGATNYELLHEGGYRAGAERRTSATRSTAPPPPLPQGIPLPSSVSFGFIIPFMTLAVDLEQLALSSTSQRLSKMRQVEALLFSVVSGKIKYGCNNGNNSKISGGDGGTLLKREKGESKFSLRSSAAREEVDTLFSSAKRLMQSLAELSTFLPEAVYASPLPTTLCPPSERIGLQSSTREALGVVKRLRAELEEALNVINAFVEAEEGISSVGIGSSSIACGYTTRDEDERVRTVAYDLSEQLYNDILLPRIAVAESILAARVALALRLPEYTRFAARMIHNTFLVTVGEDDREEVTLTATETDAEEGGPIAGEEEGKGEGGKVMLLLRKEKTRALCFSPLLQESYRRSEGDKNTLHGGDTTEEVVGYVSACTCTSIERTASLLPIPLSWLTSDLLDEAEAVLEEAQHTGNYSSLAPASGQQKQGGKSCGGGHTNGGREQVVASTTAECCITCRARNQYVAKSSLADSRKSFIALRVLVVEVLDEVRALLDAVLVLHTLFKSLHEENNKKDTSHQTCAKTEKKEEGAVRGGEQKGDGRGQGLLPRLSERVDSGHLSFSNTLVTNNATMRNNKTASSGGANSNSGGQQFLLTASSSIVSCDPLLEEICDTLLSFGVRDAESWLEDEVRNALKSYIRRLREMTSTSTYSTHSSSSVLRKKFSFGSSSKAVDAAGAVPSGGAGGTPPSALKKSKSRRAEGSDSPLRNGDDGRGLNSTPTRQQQPYSHPQHQQLQRTLSGTFSTPRKKLHMPSSSSNALRRDAHDGEGRSDTDDDDDESSEDSVVLHGTASASLVFPSQTSPKKKRSKKTHHGQGRDFLHNKMGRTDGEGSIQLLGASEYLSMHSGLPQSSSRGALRQQRALVPAEEGEESPSSFPSFMMNQSSSLSSTRHYHADDVTSLIDRLDAIMGTPAPQGVSESVALATKLYDVLGRLNMFLRRAGLSKETRVTQTGKVVPVVVDVGGGVGPSTPSPNRTLSFGSRSGLLRAVGGGGSFHSSAADVSPPSNPNTITTNAASGGSSSVAQSRVYLEHTTDEALGFGRRESVLYEQACLCYEQWTAQNAVRMELDSLVAMSDEEFYTACDSRGMLADLFARADEYCVAGGDHDDVSGTSSATPRDLVVKRMDTLLIVRIKAFHHSGEVRVLTVPQRCTFKQLMENRLAQFFPDVLTAGNSTPPPSHNYMYGCEVSFLDDGDKVRISSNEEFAELIALRRRIVIDTFAGPSLLSASSSMHLGSSQFLGRSQLLTKCLTASSELKIELYLDPLPTFGRGGGGGRREVEGKGTNSNATATAADDSRRGNAGPTSFVSSPPKAPKPRHYQQSYESASNTLLLEEETKRIGLNELIRRQEAEEAAQQRMAGVNNNNIGGVQGVDEGTRKLNLNGVDLSRVSLGTNSHFHEHRSSREAESTKANNTNSTLYSLNTTDGVELFFQRKMIEKGLAPPPPPTTTNSLHPLASPSNSLPTAGERGIRQALHHGDEDRNASLSKPSGGSTPQPPPRHSPQTIRNMFLAMGRARKDAEVLSSGGVGRGTENTTTTTANTNESASEGRTPQASDNNKNANIMMNPPQISSHVSSAAGLPLATRAGTSSVVVVDDLLSEDARKGWRVPPNPTLYSRDRPLIPQLNQSASERIAQQQQHVGEQGGRGGTTGEKRGNKKPGPLLSLSTVVIADLNESDADDEEMEALIGHPTWRRGETRDGRPLTSVDHIHAVMYGRPPLNNAAVVPTPPSTASPPTSSSSSPKARIFTTDQLRFNGPLRKNGVPLPQQAKGRAPNVTPSSSSSRPSTTPAATATGGPPKTGGTKK